MSSFTRDAEWVLSHLKTRTDTSVITGKPCSIIFPQRWVGTPLANLSTGEDVVLVVGSFMLLVEKKYTVFNAPALMPIVATKTLKDELDGVPVYIIEFDAGSVVFDSLKLIKDNNIPYYQDDNIVAKGGDVPYFSKDDRLLLTAHAKSLASLGGLPDAAYISIRTNHLMRLPNNLAKLTNKSTTGEYTAISITDVANSVPQALGKITGSYMDDGLQTVLLDETTAGNSSVDNILLAGNK